MSHWHNRPYEPSEATLSALADAGNHILWTKYAFYATYAICFYDHLITLDVEIEYIWRKSFNFVTAAFFLTRYYLLLAMTVVLFVYIDPPDKTCHAKLPFLAIGFGTPLSVLPNFVILLRIYALYGRNRILIFALLTYVLAEIVVSFWSTFDHSLTLFDVFGHLGYPELGNLPTTHICVAQLSPETPPTVKALGQIMQSLFDTIALTLILVYARRHTGGKLLTLIVKQGLVYYILNVAAYLSWTFMLIFAPYGYKSLMTAPALSFACIAVNRLTLHLKSCNADASSEASHSSSGMYFNRRPPKRTDSWLGVSTIEVPSESFETDETDSISHHEMQITVTRNVCFRHDPEHTGYTSSGTKSEDIFDIE